MPPTVIFAVNRTNKKYQRCIWQRGNANLGNEDCLFECAFRTVLLYLIQLLGFAAKHQCLISFWNQNEFGSKERVSTKHFSLWDHDSQIIQHLSQLQKGGIYG